LRSIPAVISITQLRTSGDAYLAAFAEAAKVTLVTFDRALASKVKGSILLD